METTLTSAQKTVVIGPERPTVLIGERINPTGKKRLAAALAAGNLGVVRAEAEAQVAAGAAVLDVNVGAAGVDEVALLPQALRLVMGTVDVPVSIDSANADALRAALAHAAAPADGSWRRGVGLAGAWYRFGKTAPLTCKAHAELGLDRGITLYFSAPDYGQGSATAMAQLAAAVLGLPRDDLRLVNADTAHTPDSGIQGASRSTYWVGGAVSQAAALLRARILTAAAELLDCSPDALSLTAGTVVAGREAVPLAAVAAEMTRQGQARRVRGVFAPHPDRPASFRPGYLPFFAAGAQMAEVDVNVETGEVRVARMVAAHDVGRAVQPQNARGQIEGAVLMGLGMALLEEYVPGVTTGPRDYHLPTIRDAPAIDVILVEVPSRWGPQGAKGLGEPATVPTAPAIVNGIAHATGARVRRLPATPERVRAALQEYVMGKGLERQHPVGWPSPAQRKS